MLKLFGRPEKRVSLRENTGMRRTASPAAIQTPEGHLAEDSLSQVTGYQLAQASVMTNRVFDAQVRGPLGLRQVEFTLLALALDNPGVTPVRMAKALALTPASITMAVDRLSGLGLIRREASTTDRRAQHLVLTPDGERVASEAIQKVREGEGLRLAALTPAERLMLLELLRKVAQAR